MKDTLQVGSYDHNAAPWSDIPDVEFARMAADRYCCGEFAVGNGNPKDPKSFKDVTHHPLQYGKAVAVVRRHGPGPIALKASADGVKDGVLILE